MAKATPKQTGIFMATELFNNVLYERFGSVGTLPDNKMHAQAASLAEDHSHGPIIPFIDSLEDAHALINPLILNLHASKKAKAVFAHSLLSNLLVMANDEKSGKLVATVAFTSYLSIDQIASAKAFTSKLKGKLDEGYILSRAITDFGSEIRYADVAFKLALKFQLMKDIGIDFNGKFNRSSWDKSKTTLYQEFATGLAEEDDEADVNGFNKILVLCERFGVDLVAGLKYAEESGNGIYKKYALKMKVQANAQRKAIVSRVNRYGGKL